MPIGKASAPPTPAGGEGALRGQPTAGSGPPGREKATKTRQVCWFWRLFPSRRSWSLWRLGPPLRQNDHKAAATPPLVISYGFFFALVFLVPGAPAAGMRFLASGILIAGLRVLSPEANR